MNGEPKPDITESALSKLEQERAKKTANAQKSGVFRIEDKKQGSGEEGWIQGKLAYRKYDSGVYMAYDKDGRLDHTEYHDEEKTTQRPPTRDTYAEPYPDTKIEQKESKIKGLMDNLERGLKNLKKDGVFVTKEGVRETDEEGKETTKKEPSATTKDQPLTPPKVPSHLRKEAVRPIEARALRIAELQETIAKNEKILTDTTAELKEVEKRIELAKQAEKIPKPVPENKKPEGKEEKEIFETSFLRKVIENFLRNREHISLISCTSLPPENPDEVKIEIRVLKKGLLGASATVQAVFGNESDKIALKIFDTDANFMTKQVVRNEIFKPLQEISELLTSSITGTEKRKVKKNGNQKRETRNYLLRGLEHLFFPVKI